MKSLEKTNDISIVKEAKRILMKQTQRRKGVQLKAQETETCLLDVYLITFYFIIIS